MSLAAKINSDCSSTPSLTSVSLGKSLETVFLSGGVSCCPLSNFYFAERAEVAPLVSGSVAILF